MFCKSVWNGIHILPDGYIRLCSLGTNSIPELDMQRARDKSGNVMHILTHSLEEICNSDKHRSVRTFNIENPNSWSPHCACCESRELVTNYNRNHPNKSRRVYLLSMDTDNIVNENNYSTNNMLDGTVNWMPNSLDIRFGNLCNQKCVMCGPTFSNQWYDEFVEYFKTNEFGQGEKISIIKDPKTNKWIEPPELKWFEDPRWWQKFDTLMPHLKHIYITGGEPMIAPAHDEMLDKLIEAGYAKDIWLEYDSNCSAINPKIISKWYYFKSVHIRGSMDGINQEYELIRYGGKWTKFVENVKILKNIENESNGKIKLLSLSSCVTLLNMLTIKESEEFCKSINANFHVRFLEGPSFLSLYFLPDQAKKDVIEFHKRNMSNKSEMIINLLNENLKNSNHNKNNIKEFYDYMSFLDNSRKTNWKQTFPKIYNFLQNYE